MKGKCSRLGSYGQATESSAGRFFLGKGRDDAYWCSLIATSPQPKKGAVKDVDGSQQLDASFTFGC